MTTSIIKRLRETTIKKIALSFLTLMVFVCCVSCGTTKTNFYITPTLIPYEEDKGDSDILADATDPSEEQMKICNSVVEEISKVYEISKGIAEIKCLPEENFMPISTIDWPAMYDARLNILFISTKFDMNGVPCFCHEYFHYLSDNGDDGLSGIMNMFDNGNDRYLIGIALDKGIAEYFSSKVNLNLQNSYMYQNDYQYVYEYEKHVASELAIIFGEDKLWQAFTTGDFESLKTDFNQKVENKYNPEKIENIELTPFDVLQSVLDNHQHSMASFYSTSEEHGLNVAMKDFASNINCIEEMLFNYSSKSSCTESSIKEVNDFLTNSSGYFSYRSLTYIREIWGIIDF